jgi:hypothetical protein
MARQFAASTRQKGANYGHTVRPLKSWAVSTEAAPAYAGFSKDCANGGSIDVDFSDDALYASYTPEPQV